MAEGKGLGMMLPKGMEFLNIEYWKEDDQQILDLSWILKMEVTGLKELSSSHGI